MHAFVDRRALAVFALFDLEAVRGMGWWSDGAALTVLAARDGRAKVRGDIGEENDRAAALPPAWADCVALSPTPPAPWSAVGDGYLMFVERLVPRDGEVASALVGWIPR
jgi:hypothetical protein